MVEQVAGDAVRFQFTDLCKAVMGSADYQAIAQRFSTVFLTDVPALSIQARSLALLRSNYTSCCLMACSLALLSSPAPGVTQVAVWWYRQSCDVIAV